MRVSSTRGGWWINCVVEDVISQGQIEGGQQMESGVKFSTNCPSVIARCLVDCGLRASEGVQ
jgi:hypothetical protein